MSLESAAKRLGLGHLLNQPEKLKAEAEKILAQTEARKEEYLKKKHQTPEENK